MSYKFYFVSLHYRKESHNMDKDLTNSEIAVIKAHRKRRSDAGKRHRSPKYEGIILRKYRLNGEFVAEYDSIDDAVSDGDGLTYHGIYNCIHGKQTSYGGYLWRCSAGSGRGLLVL